jgi:hypothetical protein
MQKYFPTYEYTTANDQYIALQERLVITEDLMARLNRIAAAFGVLVSD